MSEVETFWKTRARITLEVDVKWNSNLYASYNFSFGIADNATGRNFRSEYGANESVKQHTNNFAQKLF